MHDRDANETGVFDEQGGISTERVSVSSDGEVADRDAEHPAISADGRHVVFSSFADNLVPNDTNGLRDVFVHDRETGATVPPGRPAGSA